MDSPKTQFRVYEPFYANEPVSIHLKYECNCYIMLYQPIMIYKARAPSSVYVKQCSLCIQEEYSSYLPLNIFGGLSLIAGVLVVLLPETRNKPLPETMEDAEMLGKTRPIKSELSKGGVAEDLKPRNGIVNNAMEDSDWL